MPSPLPLASKLAYYAVELSYGDPLSYERYVLKAGQETVAGKTFSQMPTGSLELGSYSVGFTTRPLTLVLPLLPGLLSGLAVSGEPFYDTARVKVYEVVRGVTGGGQAVDLVLADGFVYRATKNFRGREGMVGLEIGGEKLALQAPMGIPVNAECAWGFQSTGCGVSATPHQATVLTIGNKTITVGTISPAIPSSVDEENDEYLHRGYASYQGINIPIRGWNVDEPNTVLLSRTAPVAWLGKAISLVPGCDKSLTTCVDRWDNEERFLGLGIGMPPYKPLFENPS